LICGTSATSYLGVLREGDVPYGKAARNTNTIQRDVEDAIPYSLLRKDAIPYRKNQLSMIKVYRFQIVPPSRMPSLMKMPSGIQTHRCGTSRTPSPTFCFATIPSLTGVRDVEDAIPYILLRKDAVPYIFLFCVIF